jgi:hypothetical protein
MDDFTGVMPEVEPAAGEDWVKASAEAFEEFMRARKAGEDLETPARAVLGFFAKMRNFVRGKDISEVRNILVEHEGVARAQSAEDMLIQAFAGFREAEVIPEAPQAVVIDARPETGFDPDILKVMYPAIKTITTRDKLIKVCLVSPDPEPPEEIAAYVTHIQADGTVPVEDIISQVQEEFGIEPTDISIATGEQITESITEYLKVAGANGASFAVLGKAVLTDDAAGRRISRLVPAMTAMNLLNRALDELNRPAVLAVGCDDKNLSLIETIQRILNLVKITAINISREVTSRIESLRAISIAL